MHGLNRIAKDSLPDDFLTQMEEELGIDHLDIRCHLRSMPRYVRIHDCCTRCKAPCDRSVKFQFVMDHCSAELCTYESPCDDCLETIAVVKLYKNIVREHEGFSMRRFSSYARKRNKGVPR